MHRGLENLSSFTLQLRDNNSVEFYSDSGKGSPLSTQALTFNQISNILSTLYVEGVSSSNISLQLRLSSRGEQITVTHSLEIVDLDLDIGVSGVSEQDEESIGQQF